MSNLLTAEVEETLKPRPGLNVILAVGNSLRSDDGVGPYVAAHLKSSEKLKVVDAGSSPENVIGEVAKFNPSYIIVVDAADFKGTPGEVRLIAEEHIPETALSTHAISLKVIARILSEDTGAELHFLGIQPKSVAMGEDLSAEVKTSAHAVIERIKKEFRS